MITPLAPNHPRALAVAGAALLALAAGAAAGAAAPEVPLEDHVEAVTLYSNQAMIRRVARARVDAGQHRLAFSPLPSACDHGSVRVLVDGARLQGFEIVQGYGEAELPPEIQERKDRIEAIDRALSEVDARRSLVQGEIATLVALPPPAAANGDDGTPPDVSAAAMRRFLDWQARRVDAAGTRMTELDLRRVELVEEREVLTSELLGTSGAGAALARPRVVVLVEAEAATTVDLVLVYRTWSARWVPSYDVRLTTGADTMELGINALVWQQTEEDWSDVELTLSTAVPAHSANLPELMAWFIEETPPSPPPPEPMPSVAAEADRRDASPRRTKAKKQMASMDAPAAAGGLAASPGATLADDGDYGYGAYGYDDYGYGYAVGAAESISAPPSAAAVADGVSTRQEPPREGLIDRLAREQAANLYLQDHGMVLMDTSQTQNLISGAATPFQPVGALVLDATAVGQGYDTSPAGWGPYAPSSNAMGFDFAFEAGREVDVPSDGQVHEVPLGSRTYTARLEHVVVPFVDEAAYVQAVVENGSPYPMLAGMSDVFLDGGYLGRLTTRTVAPGEPLEMALGIDRTVKVERTQKQLSDKGGLFGNQKVRVFQIEIEIENYRDTPIHIRLTDRQPYSYEDEIKITAGDRSAEPSQDLGLGLLRWDLDLAAGASETVRFEYELRHNKNYRVWHPEG